MIEQDAVGGVDTIGLAVVHRDPVAVQLRNAVRRARIKWRGLPLRYFLNEAVAIRG